MPIQFLTLETLGDLDGGAARLAINKAIAIAMNDVDDRGSDEKPRKVMIELKFTKLKNNTVDTGVTVGTNLPKMTTWTTNGHIRAARDGEIGFAFSSESPENPDQRTFNDEVDGFNPREE